MPLGRQERNRGCLESGLNRRKERIREAMKTVKCEKALYVGRIRYYVFE